MASVCPSGTAYACQQESDYVPRLLTTRGAPNDSYICLLCGYTLHDCPYAKPDISEMQLINRLHHIYLNG